MRKAVLALACVLLAPMFLVGITASAPYDPWSDLDADGDIDIFDIVKIAGSYATTGDPGKNVTIAGRESKLAFSISGRTVAAGGYYYTDWIDVRGYSKVTVNLYHGSFDASYRLETAHYLSSFAFYVDVQPDIGNDLVKTYDVPNEYIRVYFANNEATARLLTLDIYLIA